MKKTLTGRQSLLSATEL